MFLSNSSLNFNDDYGESDDCQFLCDVILAILACMILCYLWFCCVIYYKPIRRGCVTRNVRETEIRHPLVSVSD